MSWFDEQWQRVRHFISRRRGFDNDLAEEMRLHLDLRAEENPAAEREARLRFGNLSRIKEDSRAAWGWPTLGSIVQDVRYGMRTLGASPAFTITAVLSLTLGIGANTAIFSLLNAIMLRTLPVKDPGRLVGMRAGSSEYFGNVLWQKLRDGASSLDGALAYGQTRFDLSAGGDRQYANGLMVSGTYFATLGVPALRGRLIMPEDDKRGCGANGPAAVISERFWLNHFNGEPSVVGRMINLDRHPFRIIGVTPAWFTGLDKDRQYDVAAAIGCDPIFTSNSLDDNSYAWLKIVGRLKAGVTIERAQAQLRAIDPEFARSEEPRRFGGPLQLNHVSTGFSALGEQYGKALFTLQAVVVIVLLIACANVANLLLGRAGAREREIGVRLAIGAGRGRIVRQLLTESLLLGLGGASAGLLLALWGTRLLIRMLSSTQRLVELDPHVDLTVVGFTGLAVILTTLAFGLLPALRASSAEPNGVLNENARGSITGGGGGHLTLTNAMIVVQLSLALTLLSAAALFGESFRRLLNVDGGFDSRNVIVMDAELPLGVPLDQSRQVFGQALERLRRIPGVAAASRSARTPVAGGWWQWMLYPEGPQSKPDRYTVYFNCASPGYFQTLGAKLISGRDFDSRDTLSAQRVIVIDEAAAHMVWGAVNPIGRTITMRAPDLSNTKVSSQVIGVVKNMKYTSLSEEPHPTVFVPLSQVGFPATGTTFELRLDSSNGLTRVLPLARAALIEADGNLSLDIQTLDSQISDSLIQPRLLATLAGFFGAVALVLASTGLYGVIAYATARRKAEIGLRMALGATPANVLSLVLRDIASTVVAGAVLGLVAARFAGGFVTSLIFGVKPTDPVVLGAALAVLIATAAIAAYLPAHRAARLDPMESLRIE